MSSIFLSMRANGAAPAQALRFERGRPTAEFSVGRRGAWQTCAPGVADRHVCVGFDGQCIVLRRDPSSPPVSIDGKPLPLLAERIVRLPCRIELGGARLIVDDEAPPAPTVDASALVPAPREPAGRDAARPFEPVAVARCVVVQSTPGAPPVLGPRASPRPPAEPERLLDDGHATSVMPLEVMRQRGLLPSTPAPPSPPAPGARPARRRRANEARRRAAAPWRSALARWSTSLVPRLAPLRKRWLRWALALPMLPVLCYALAPSASRATPPAAVAVDAGERRERPATDAPARGAAPGARPLLEPVPRAKSRSTDAAAQPAPGPSAPRAPRGTDLRRARDEEAERQRDHHARPRDAARPPDARGGLTAERSAADALAAGDPARALSHYLALAERDGANVAFAEAARILAQRRGPQPAPARARDALDGVAPRDAGELAQGPQNGASTHAP